MTKDKDSVIIFSPSKARKLLKEGHTLIDLKPDKKDATHHRSLFVFLRTQKLMNRLRELTNEYNRGQ